MRGVIELNRRDSLRLSENAAHIQLQRASSSAQYMEKLTLKHEQVCGICTCDFVAD